MKGSWGARMLAPVVVAASSSRRVAWRFSAASSGSAGCAGAGTGAAGASSATARALAATAAVHFIQSDR